MKEDILINRLAYITGSSRKQVIESLRQLKPVLKDFNKKK